MVARFGNRQPGFGGEKAKNLLRKTLRGVDAGANRGAAERNLCGASNRALDALDAVANLRGITTELLAECHRGCIHEVGAASLDHGFPKLGLNLERLC